MIRTITSYDVIQYFYGEQVDVDHQIIKNSIENNSELLALWNELKNSNKLLTDNLLEPSKKSIDHIVLYSKTFGTQN